MSGWSRYMHWHTRTLPGLSLPSFGITILLNVVVGLFIRPAPGPPAVLLAVLVVPTVPTLLPPPPLLGFRAAPAAAGLPASRSSGHSDHSSALAHTVCTAAIQLVPQLSSNVSSAWSSDMPATSTPITTTHMPAISGAVSSSLNQSKHAYPLRLGICQLHTLACGKLKCRQPHTKTNSACHISCGPAIHRREHRQHQAYHLLIFGPFRRSRRTCRIVYGQGDCKYIILNFEYSFTQ